MPSSSAIVSVAVRTVRPEGGDAEPNTTVSPSPSSTLSFTGSKVKVSSPSITFAGIVTVTVPGSRKSSPAVAASRFVFAMTVTATSVSAARAALLSSALIVTCRGPPSSSICAGSTESCTEVDARSLSSTSTSSATAGSPA